MILGIQGGTILPCAEVMWLAPPQYGFVSYTFQRLFRCLYLTDMKGVSDRSRFA